MKKTKILFFFSLLLMPLCAKAQSVDINMTCKNFTDMMEEYKKEDLEDNGQNLKIENNNIKDILQTEFNIPNINTFISYKQNIQTFCQRHPNNTIQDSLENIKDPNRFNNIGQDLINFEPCMTFLQKYEADKKNLNDAIYEKSQSSQELANYDPDTILEIMKRLCINPYNQQTILKRIFAETQYLLSTYPQNIIETYTLNTQSSCQNIRDLTQSLTSRDNALLVYLKDQIYEFGDANTILKNCDSLSYDIPLKNLKG